MITAVEIRHQGRPLTDRLAAGFVLCLLAIGTLGLWIGVPLATLWWIGELTDTSERHFLFGVIGVPLAMALYAPLLFWLNGLYLRIRAAHTPEPEEEWADEDEPRVVRGPLEPMLVLSFVVAVVAITVWFFFFAENPARNFW